MKTAGLFSAVAGLATLVDASPVTPSRTIHIRQDNTTSSAPCAKVSEYMYGDGTTVVNQQVPAEIAWNCINDVPLNATSAKRLIAAIRPYIDWQSTLDVLKNPPADYVEKVQPPVDIVGGLDQIDEDIDNGVFENEYAFGWALYTLIQSAHDGHFGYTPDSVGGIFTWGRPTPLVSVSEDGEKLPAVFVFEDVLGMQFQNISYTPSPVTQIDDIDAIEFLETLSQFGALQDRDALYNNVFYELAQVSLGNQGTVTGMFTGGGRGRFVYPGATTTLKFANGSEYTMQNYAKTQLSFRNISDGVGLAEKWFSYGSQEDLVLQSDQADVEPEVPGLQGASGAAPGYPTPIVPGPQNLINGFYIDAPGYEDVAVLQVPNFVGSTSAEAGFQKVTQNFIPKALADGKTKLIIDLQANGGGTILQGYDMFKQLFPDLDPYGANRFRATESGNIIGQVFSDFSARIPRVANQTNTTVLTAQGSYFDKSNDMTVDGKPFSSWDEKFGPYLVNGDLYTGLSRWNLSDVHITWSSGGIYISGYGPLANITGPPKFKPENIVIVTDGYCASTCTIFSEFMTKQAGVKTIAMGGRSNKNKIQAIGGVKGVNNYQFSYIQQLAQYAVRFDPSEKTAPLKQDFYSDIPFNRVSGGPGVNTRDGLPLNDTGVALQFIYEEADCRLYYTPDMTVDITALWRAAADAQWGNSGKCVGGAKYGEKRGINEMTTKLNRRRMQVSEDIAMAQVEAFENSFSLETECKLNGDGFMHP